MNLTLKVWRQDGPQDKGHLETHQLSGVTGDMSFLEMMDVLNDKIIREGGDPIAFDHDCREGICGMCSMFINGEAHGPGRGVTTCQLHMRSPVHMATDALMSGCGNRKWAESHEADAQGRDAEAR